MVSLGEAVRQMLFFVKAMDSGVFHTARQAREDPRANWVSLIPGARPYAVWVWYLQSPGSKERGARSSLGKLTDEDFSAVPVLREQLEATSRLMES